MEATQEDFEILFSRVLESKWNDAPLITLHNSVQFMHNKHTLLTLTWSLGIQALICVAKNTF